MTFGKRDDGCWHWEYTGPCARGTGRNLWIVWLLVMIFFFATLGILIAAEDATPLILRVVLLAGLGVGVFVTLVFALVWLWIRFGKKGCGYTAGESVLSPYRSLHSGRYSRVYFEQVKSLTQCRERNAIILKATGLPMEVYANDADYDAVWNFLKDRCPNAEIEEPRRQESGVTSISKPASNEKKPDGRVSTLWALGVMLLVLGVAFSIGWGTRGPRIHDFTGVGQAEILKMTIIDRPYKDRLEIIYRFDVRITAGEESFVSREERSSRHNWNKGDILPIAYNIQNPREYIIDSTPEAYARWYRSIGLAALGLMLGAVCCFGKAYRIKRLSSERSTFG